MIKGIWWKLLAVIILLYVIIMGLTVPLKPGIAGVSPDRANPGDTLVLDITGYNTNFSTAGTTLSAWLKINDAFVLKASDVRPANAVRMQARFNIPENIPERGEVHPLSLIISDSIDGAFVLPSAVFLSGRESTAHSEGWIPAGEMDIRHQNAFRYPYRNILYETIRNVYFHVPMWFGMLIMFFAGAWCSIRFIRSGNPVDDLKSLALTTTGTVYGILGLLTGMLWSRSTWGAFWSWDIKQNTAAIAVLIYLAYFVLRNSLPDPDRRSRLAAVYNTIAAVMLIPLLFVIPRMTDSLHPGSGGNPALGGEDLDNTMRVVFYPAVIGWTLLGVWISELRYRILRLRVYSVYEK